MAQSWSKAFYESRAWRANARAYLASQDGLCERCRALGKLVPAEIVHHRKHLTPETIHDPNMTMAWDNLEALCQDCHNREHHSSGAVRRYQWTETGDILPQ